MNSIKDYIALVRKLPPSVNLAWLLMHVGLGIMIIGMVEARWPLLGIGAGIFAAAGAITFVLKDEMAIRFSTALIITMIGAFAVMVIVAPICLLAVVGLAIFDGFSLRGVLGVLSFLTVLFAFQVVTSVPTFANREPGEKPSDLEPPTE